jgi:hypothetical protein
MEVSGDRAAELDLAFSLTEGGPGTVKRSAKVRPREIVGAVNYIDARRSGVYEQIG